MPDVPALIHALVGGKDVATKRNAANQLPMQLIHALVGGKDVATTRNAGTDVRKDVQGNYAKQALEHGVWSALLDRLADPDEDGRVHESVLLCMAELFTPASHQLASAANAHLRLAADLLVKPDDLVDDEGVSPLLCQLALHLLGPVGERAPGTLAITRILVALLEHMGASCQHEMLHSEVMQALMVAVAKPVGKHATSGVLCALALFHLIMASPGLLLTALSKGSELVPSLCTLMYHVLDGVTSSAYGSDPPSSSLKVLPSDCVCALLHCCHMRPWLKHTSLHQEHISKLILHRICESKAVACLVSYVEHEAASLQDVLDEVATCTQAEMEAAVERIEQLISDTVTELEAARHALEFHRKEMHSLKSQVAPHSGLPSAALLEQLEHVQEGKALVKHQVHGLKHKLSSLYYQRRVLGKQLKGLVPQLQQVRGHSQSKSARAQWNRPSCNVLLQATSTLAQLASPLATANKGPDPELEQMQASIQRQMLKSDLIAVSLGLATSVAGLELLVRLEKSLLRGLGIVEDTASELSAAAMLIQSHLKHLEGVKTRLSFEIKQVKGELYRMAKAHAFGFPRGMVSYSVPLTSENTLCTGIRSKDLKKRESKLQGELESLEDVASTVLGTMEVLEKHLEQVQERQAALAALTSKKTASQLSSRGAPHPPNGQHHHHSHQSDWDSQGNHALQHACRPLLSSLGSHLHRIAFPERAVDHLHDLLLPPYLTTTTATEHTTNLTATSPVSVRPSSASSHSRRIGDIGRGQQQHQGQHQAQEFKMKHASHAPNFHSHEGAKAVQSSSPAYSMPSSPRGSPASPKVRPASAQAALPSGSRAQGDVGTSHEDLGPDLSKANVFQRALRVLDAVHSSISSSQLLSSKNGLEQEEHGMSHPQRPPIDVDALCQQSSDLESTIASLSALASKAHTLVISARMLPTYCTSAVTKADALETLMEPLMANFVWCLRHQRSKSGCAVAHSVADIAKKGLTKPADYASVFANTGILDALLEQLYSEGGSKPPGSPTAKSQEGSPKEVSRYTLVVPTLRPSGPGVARQAAAAMALLEVGQVHLEALDAVASDEEAIPSLCYLVLDCSLDTAARLSAAALIAATVSLCTEDSAQLSLRKGAFTALMFVMDSDHRQGSTNAKGWVIAALAAICLNEGLRCLIPDLLYSRADGMGMGSPRKTSKHAAATQKLKDAFVLQNDEQVQVAILQTLWGVPLQLVALLSTDAAKGGRTIEAATVKPLYRLGELASNTLASVVTEDPGTRLIARRLAIGSKINIVFLQAIKDAALHSALMKLKAQV